MTVPSARPPGKAAAARRASVRSDLRRSMIDGGAFSVMVGLGEWYFPAFVLALALGEVPAGLVATVPQMIGALAALALWSRGVNALASHKRWVLVVVALQALAFVPLAIGAAIGQMSVWMVFAATALYFGGGLAGGAAWSTWIGTLVPRGARSKFFGRRQRILQLGTLVGFLAGGIVLQLVRSAARDAPSDSGIHRAELWTFCAIFVLAGICRVVSLAFLCGQSEPEPMPVGNRSVGLAEVWSRVRAPLGSQRGRDARLIVYMLAANGAAQIGSPCVHPYLLKDLHQPYASYAALVGLVVLAKVLVLGPMGGVAKRIGARRLLLMGGVGVVPLGFLFAASSSVWWLAASQVYSGIAWAAWELATFLLVLEHLRPEERTSLMSTYYAANACAIAAGSMVGGLLLHALGDTHAAYVAVFCLSSAARVLTLWPLVRVLHEPGSDPGAFTPAVPPLDAEAWPATRAE